MYYLGDTYYTRAFAKINLNVLGWSYKYKDLEDSYWKMPAETVRTIYNDSIEQVLDAVEQPILAYTPNAAHRWMYGYSVDEGGEVTDIPRTGNSNDSLRAPIPGQYRGPAPLELGSSYTQDQANERKRKKRNRRLAFGDAE